MKKLDESTIQKIRSDYTINSFHQAMEELILNSIDAKATKIEINFDLSQLELQVVDNGFGIEEKNIKSIGNRFSIVNPFLLSSNK